MARCVTMVWWMALSYVIAAGSVSACLAESVITVPRDQMSIQAAVEVAQSGDTVLVSPGTYREHVRLKPGVTLKSAGNDEPAKLGLKRAEATIIDGGHSADQPGVAMAEGAVLDGFTITNVGRYDDEEWRKHHANQGNDQPHEHIGEPGVAGISIVGVTCIVRHNIVHHIGYTGIAVTGVERQRCSPHLLRNICYRNMGGGIGSMKGSTAIIEDNSCFQNFYAGIGHDGASPLVVNNTCYENIRAGIGVSEGSQPIVRGNRCYKNRRAGIGIRTGADTSPVIERNQCFENDMAGIGCEEKATPIIRDNQCERNALAGIGVTGQARPLIHRNVCRKNRQAGIGIEGQSDVTILENRCLENETVAIGLRHESSALIARNELERHGGMPPLIAIREGSSATILENQFRGGGVAGVLIDGRAVLRENDFRGDGPRGGGPPHFAVWVQKNAEASVSDNRIAAWRHGVHSDGAKRLIVSDNSIRQFAGTALVVKNTARPAQVTDNTAFSASESDKVVSVEGSQESVARNQWRSETITRP